MQPLATAQAEWVSNQGNTRVEGWAQSSISLLTGWSAFLMRGWSKIEGHIGT